MKYLVVGLQRDIYYKPSSDLPSYYTSAVDAGAMTWHNYTNVYLSKNTSSALITAYAYDYGNMDWAGKAFVNPGFDSGTYTSGNIHLNRYACDSMDQAKRQIVAMHEFGHVLGLAHNSNNKSIMYGTSVGGEAISAYLNNPELITKPHQDDIDGITFLYSY